MFLAPDRDASRCRFHAQRAFGLIALLLFCRSLVAAPLPGSSRCAGVVDNELIPYGLVFADGTGLPEGIGEVATGENIYHQRCRGCHGDAGMGAVAVELVADHGTLSSPFPDKAVGSYWYAAPTLFGYIQQAMPPQNIDKTTKRLNNDESYSVVAYILWLNGLLEADVELNAELLRSIKMPNRHGFDRSKQANQANTYTIDSVCNN